jgi:histone deacetylase 1/2
VDIDIHHGDGVEEAFLETERVMTVSFHKYGDFFPGTGALDDIGHDTGKYYSVNVPLQEGMDDDSYRYVYEPIMTKVMEVYQPHAIVVCSGADSLAGDRLGCFNLSLEGHSQCIEFLEKYNLPLLVVGGGGYTMRNVSRCWCYETGRMLGMDLDDQLPKEALANTDYWVDTHKLRIMVSNMKNSNTRSKLEDIRNTVLQNLAALKAAPSVGMSERPPDHHMSDLPEEEMDERGGGKAARDVRVDKDDGYGSDNEVDSKGDMSWNTGTARGAGATAPSDAREDDSSEGPQPSSNVRGASAEPRNTGGQIAPVGGILGLGGEADKPAGETRQKSPESAAQPMLVDGTVLEEDTHVTDMDIERAQEIAADQQQQQQP